MQVRCTTARGSDNDLSPGCFSGNAPELLQLLDSSIELIAIAIADAVHCMRLRTNVAVGVLPHGPGRPGRRDVGRRRAVLRDPQKTLREHGLRGLAAEFLFDEGT